MRPFAAAHELQARDSFSAVLRGATHAPGRRHGAQSRDRPAEKEHVAEVIATIFLAVAAFLPPNMVIRTADRNRAPPDWPSEGLGYSNLGDRWPLCQDGLVIGTIGISSSARCSAPGSVTGTRNSIRNSTASFPALSPGPAGFSVPARSVSARRSLAASPRCAAQSGFRRRRRCSHLPHQSIGVAGLLERRLPARWTNRRA